MNVKCASALVTLAAVFVFTFAALPMQAQSSAPHIFYSDLTSGPNTGGENGKGAVVTIYGARFGATQGASRVTVGGVAADNYRSWSDNKISFQLGSSAASGNIVVTVDGASSNPVPFTVRAGNIYFVSATGSDAGDGSFAAPWQTVAHAQAAAAAGSIIYALDGVQQITPDANQAALSLSKQGTSSAPIALIAYPGAKATLGSASATRYGIYASSARWWVISGFQIAGGFEAISATSSPGLRLVGNDISCPSATGTGACVAGSAIASAKMLGNTIHDVGASGAANSGYQAVFANSNGLEFGWNQIARVHGCYGLQLQNPGAYLHGLQIHDNFIHDTVCSAISLPAVDPSTRAVRLYNNVVARAGTGPDPGNANFACLQVGGSGAGTVQITNNTLNDCGAQAGANAGALEISTPASFTDNIVSTTASEAYIAPASGASSLKGSNDLFYGSGTPPATITSALTANPMFAAPAQDNYQLQATSPAIDQGTTTTSASDFSGTPRPQGAAYDVGAFEFTTATTASTAATASTTGLVADVTTSSDASNSNTTLASKAFSTTAGNELLLAFIGADGPSSTTNYVTSVSGAGLTWSRVARANAQLGTAEVWRAFATSALANVTVTATFARAAAASMTIVGFQGADASGGDGSGAIGATATQSAASGAPSASVVTTRNNSWVFGVGNDWDNAIARTLGPNQTMVHQYLATVNDTYWVQGQAAPTPQAGTTVAINDTAPTSDQWNLAVVEVLPAQSSGGTTYAISGAISPSTAAGGTTVTLAQNGTTVSTTTADSSGNFSFTGLQNGTYNVTPSNASYTFSPASQSVTINSADATGVNFTATSSTAATLAANPTTIDFGSITAGTSSTKSLTISNTGNASASISAVTASGTAFSVSGITTPYTLAAGASVTLQVTFAPSTASTYSGSVTINSDASNSTLSVPLSGTATAAASATLAANPTSIAFGSITAGTTSTKPLTISNTGNASATISAAAASGTGFSVSGITTPYTLAAGASVTLQVTFAPATANTYSGSVTISSDASNPTLAVPLSGTATAPATATLAANPTSIGFGTVTVGTTATKPLVLSNTGNASATISAATASGTGFAVSGITTPYTLAAGASVTLQVSFTPAAATTYSGSVTVTSNASNSPTTVPLSGAGQTSGGSGGGLAVDVTTSFDSSAANNTISSNAFSTTGSNELLLAFISSDSGSNPNSVTGVTGGGLTWSLVARSNAQLGTAEVWRAFAGSPLTNASVTATLAQSAATSITVVAFQGADTSGSGGSGAIGATAAMSAASGAPSASLVTTRNNSWVFGVGNDWDNATARTLGANQTMVHQYLATVNDTYWVQAQATPTPLSGTTVTINDTTPTADQWNLALVEVLPAQSSGTASATLTANPTSIAFGSITAGTSSTKPLTISNTGNASATISAAAASGTGFTVSGITTPYTLAAGASVTLQVTFSPSAANTYSGSVAISSNASNPSLTVPLSGTGTSTTSSHSVSLAWTDSASGIAGYNVYRASSSGGPYTKINSSLVTTPSYTDSNVTSGTTYYYVVTAVNTSGVESAYSAQATAVIPTP